MGRQEPLSSAVWPEMKYLAEKVRWLREKKGLKQTEYAEQLGVAPSYIAHIEQMRANLTFQSLIKLSLTLGVPLSELIFDRNSQPEN